ncbi:LysR substrate-binding domain-containing protein [Tumidithrix helvetica PCC 7403]|uniref:LysR family transcriptional regulator n=1 Tax=Tumidithrix helvetica TaxID=3457545 RepID=UPI003C91BB7B
MAHRLLDTHLSNQITLHQLQVFEVAARHGSYTRAAEELYLTQPTVSMQIKQLTKVIGIPLFEQVGKRLFLTNAGKELFSTCQEIFTKLSQYEMTVADMKGLKQGHLKIAVVTTAKYVIPRLLGPFCQRYPGIDVSLKVTNHNGIIDRLSENKDDLYILSQLPTDIDITSYPFLENPLVVLAARNHPLAHETNIPLQRLADEPFIMRESGSGTRRFVQKLFDEHKTDFKIKLELASNEAIKQAIAGGLGISILSRHTVALEGATGQLAVLDVQGFPIQCHWHVMHLASKQLSVVSNAFLNYLQGEGKQIIEQNSLW